MTYDNDFWLYSRCPEKCDDHITKSFLHKLSTNSTMYAYELKYFKTVSQKLAVNCGKYNEGTYSFGRRTPFHCDRGERFLYFTQRNV